MEWVDRIASHLTAVDGLPPITGRVLGWLMVCEPVEQSAGQIAEAIGASRGSMTPNLRQLTGVGFVERINRPGSRTTYYRLVDNAWQAVVEQQVAALRSFRAITAEGIDLLDARSERSRRVRQADHVLQRLQDVLSDVVSTDEAEGGAPAPAHRSTPDSGEQS
ncbi:GbsR/MarR family transcriptional regulator [Nocardiopsis ganjiahuensis]|uniref:GbsR/MarR family transcriptional regulator n=1 Tax=Nocardiopsis ganjiahuensis TaxID=239984 RepID=UPI000346A467|nr:transcriptional regulator [Nocardiopsis ganjiahuensis]